MTETASALPGEQKMAGCVRLAEEYLDDIAEQYRAKPSLTTLIEYADSLASQITAMYTLEPEPDWAFEGRSALLPLLAEQAAVSEVALTPGTKEYAARILAGRVAYHGQSQALEKRSIPLIRRMTAFACELAEKEMAQGFPVNWGVAETLRRTIYYQMHSWDNLLQTVNQEKDVARPHILNNEQEWWQFIEKEDVVRLYDIFVYCLRQNTLELSQDETIEFMLRYLQLKPAEYLSAWESGFDNGQRNNMRQQNMLRIVALEENQPGSCARLRQHFGLRCLARYPLKQLCAQSEPSFMRQAPSARDETDDTAPPTRAAMVTAVYDPLNAFYHPIRHKKIFTEARATNGEVAMFEVNDTHELAAFHRIVPWYDFKHVLFQMHSTSADSRCGSLRPDGTSPEGSTWTTADAIDDQETLFACYEKVKRITFNGCSTSGQGGLAETLALATGREVVGLTNPIAVKISYGKAGFKLKRLGSGATAGIFPKKHGRRGYVKTHHSTQLNLEQQLFMREQRALDSRFSTYF